MLYVQLMQSAACRAIKEDIFKLELLDQEKLLVRLAILN